MKRVILLIMGFFLLISCTAINYFYIGKPLNNDEDYRKYVMVSASLGIDNEDENALVKLLTVYSKDRNMDVEIIPSNITILDRNKKYNLKVDEKYKNTIDLLEQNVKINNEFIAHIGKVKLSNGTILNIPPLKFNKYVSIYKYNGVMDALDKGDKREIFSGTVENYKKRKK